MIRIPIEELVTVVWGNVMVLVRTQGTAGMTAISLVPISFGGTSAFFVFSSVAGVFVGVGSLVLAGASCDVEPLG